MNSSKTSEKFDIDIRIINHISNIITTINFKRKSLNHNIYIPFAPVTEP